MTEKVKLTREQAVMIENHKSDFRSLMFKWNAEGCTTHLDKVSAEDVVKAFFDSYEVEPEYKVGDWVVIEKCNNGDHVGNIQKLVNISSDTYDFERFWYYKKNVELRHATPEEIKAEQERRVWAGIGREVGEFKKDDVVRCLKNLTWDNHYDLGEMYKKGKLKGFYPAESFISFEEVEPNA